MFLFAYPRSMVQVGLTRVLSAAGDCEVEEAYSGAEAIKRLSPQHTLLVCAWRLPDMSALRLTQQINQLALQVPVMIVSQSTRPEDVAATLRAGCRSYLWVGSTVEELREALAYMQQGVTYVSRHVDNAQLRGLMQKPGKKLAVELLTPRQQEVLALLAAGWSIADIARHLGISSKTAETHRATIRERTGCTTLAALSAFAWVNGVTCDASKGPTLPEK